MSKHLGNILEPIPLMDRHGADAVRWFMLARRLAVVARRVGHETLREVVRKVLLTYWNTARFFTLYADAPRLGPAGDAGPARADRPLLDRWALGGARAARPRGHRARWRTSTPRAAGRLLAAFVDDLSNWYVRRSRRRFWDGDPAALATLHEVLETLTRLHGAVHAVRHRAQLLDAASRARGRRRARLGAPRDVADGRRGARRRRAGRPDGPGAPAGRAGPVGARRRGGAHPPAAGPRRRRRDRVGALPGDLVAEVADELNVGARRAPPVGELVDVSVKSNFRAVGRRFGQADAGRREGRRGRPTEHRRVAPARATVDVDGEADPLSGDEIIVTETPARGLDGGQRGRPDGRARPDAHRRAASGPGWSARSCGWCRRPARPAGWR